MKKSFEIVGFEKHHLCDGNIRLAGLRLKGVVGSVDPFVNGIFLPDCLRVFLDKNDNVIEGKEKAFFAEEINWAKNQIGKKLQCEDLCYSAFATYGEVSIEERSGSPARRNNQG